uniref:Serine protease 35 n=1 Tax=Sinocyclocheilus grahami TaxID=75366 RepID=A0A672QYC8_SINGR
MCVWVHVCLDYHIIFYSDLLVTVPLHYHPQNPSIYLILTFSKTVGNVSKPLTQNTQVSAYRVNIHTVPATNLQSPQAASFSPNERYFVSAGRLGTSKGRRNRSRRSTTSEQPSFRWTRVKQMQVPKGWFKGISENIVADYDYAILELKRAQKTKYMDLGVIPSIKKLPAGRIHFSGFDDDRPGNLVYRFCSVSDESNDLLYQYCDAKPGSSGSGVYIRLKEPGKKKWKRKIIGVFSGHQWVDVNGMQQDYNVAVRITPPKYAQICLWVHGDSSQCRGT